MDPINKIYSNQVGISFFWKKETNKLLPHVQMVFRDIGFLLTLNELKDFSHFCLQTKQTQCNNECKDPQHCKSLLLRTPSEKIDLAVNQEELDQIHELINGTIFRVELKNWIKTEGLN